MGVMRFVIPLRESLADKIAPRIYCAGIDAVPWRSKTLWAGEVLELIRDVAESGNVYVPWPVAGFGELCLSTASLIERDEPYILQVELARGTLNRLRNYLADLESAGFAMPEPVMQRYSEAMQHFAKAATRSDTPRQAAKLAETAIDIAMKITFAVAVADAEQTLARRHQNAAKLATLFGANLGDEPLTDAIAKQFVSTFNSAVVPFTWSNTEAHQGQFDWSVADAQIDWCQRNGLRVCGGPLIDLAEQALPDWLYLWEGDLENLSSLMCSYVQHVVRRYQGKVNVWNCSARMNVSRELKLTEEQRLALSVRLIEIVRQTDPNTPIVFSFDQPWGEYMARADLDLAPIHFADALVRGDLGLTGLALNINLGYETGATAPRDPVEIITQLDHWATLGLPLMVTLCVPGGNGDDRLAQLPTLPSPNLAGEADGLESQLRWVERIVSVIISKITVQVVMFNQLRDDVPHSLAHGGLFDAQGAAKPALAPMEKLRKGHLV